MFTGLVEEGGIIESLTPGDEGARLVISARSVLDGLVVGDSVAVNGACLTTVLVGERTFAVDCVAETLRRTALGGAAAGDRVNLERPVAVGGRLDGHIVQGHIDGVGRVRAIRPEGDSAVLEIEAAPAAIAAQARAIAAEVEAQQGPTGLADKEIVAPTAYLQRLGTDIRWKRPQVQAPAIAPPPPAPAAGVPAAAPAPAVPPGGSPVAVTSPSATPAAVPARAPVAAAQPAALRE